MFDQSGHIQIVDFRFGKKLLGDSDERTYTICGMSDSLAPEIVQGKGHGFAADWWALGAFIYFLLQGEMPFGSWRESELTFARIAKGQLTLPHTFSNEAVDLITKARTKTALVISDSLILALFVRMQLLDVNEHSRLGSQGAESVKCHPWFVGIDWEGLTNKRVPVPVEIVTRINQRLEIGDDTLVAPLHPTLPETDELNTPEWLEDW